MIIGFASIINTNARAIRRNIPKYERTLREKIDHFNQILGTNIHISTGFEEAEESAPFVPQRDLALDEPFHRPVRRLSQLTEAYQHTPETEEDEQGEENLLTRLMAHSPEWLQGHLQNIQIPSLVQLTFSTIDLSFLQSLGGFFTDMARSTTFTFIYLLLLILERKSLRQKLEKLTRIRGASHMMDVGNKINRDILGYLKIKTLASLLTGLVSFAILTIFGVDFASFWAVLIFTLNYIPTIGSIIAVIFPILLSIVQFDSLITVAVLATALTSVQLAVGNVIEPRFLGKTLNLSPIAIFLFLIIWGQIWGVVGMFLAVPIMVVINIVLSNFPQTRALAVILSGDGTLTTTSNLTILSPEEEEEQTRDTQSDPSSS